MPQATKPAATRARPSQHPKVRKAAPAVKRIVDDAQRKPKLYIERVLIHGEGE